MRKINFNNIENLTVPESWVEKALLLPEKVESKKVIHFSKHTRPLVAVASLFLVCALSVSLFFFTQKDDILKTDPDFSLETAIYESTVQSTHKTENFTGESETEETENTESESTDAPTECETHQPETEVETDEPIDETTDPNSSSPNGMISNSNSSKPNSVPDSGKPKPTTKPSSKPTEKPTEIEPILPTQIPTEKPKNVIFSVSVKVEGAWGVNDVDVYCKVFDSNGNLLGSNDLFDWQHEAQFDREINNIEYYSYCASEKGLTFTQGYYTYVFYRRNGSVICSGTQYVS